MLIKNFQLGQLETNCYIVTDENTMKCAVIDPGDESNTVLDYIESNNLKAEQIFLTHGHFDHTMAADTVAEETGADIWLHKADLTPAGVGADFYTFKSDRELKFYKNGDEIEVGGLTFHVIETPGHSKGSVTLRCGNCLFTGDCLFHGSCGRVDFPGGSFEEMARSLRKLHDLEGDFEVYPGHMEATSLSAERGSNPFMKSAMGEE